MWSRNVVVGRDRYGEILCYADRLASLPAVLGYAADRWPDREHLVEDDRRLTFADLARTVAVVAGQLRAHGVRPGDRVVLLAPLDAAWVATLWACWRAGAIAVPVNWSWTTEQLQRTIADTQPRCVLVGEDYVDRVGRDVRATLLRELTEPARRAPAIGGPGPDEQTPALIIYTTGTSGTPKGAVFTHGALLSGLQNILVTSGRLPPELADDAPAPVGLLSYPAFHIAGIANILVNTAVGARLVCTARKFDPHAILRLVERERVSAWGAVPTMLVQVLAALAERAYDVSSVRAITLGGASMPPGLADRIAATFPSVRRSVANAYGMTESGGTVALASGGTSSQDPTCVGPPMPVVRFAIAGTSVPGTRGEVLVRTPSAMTGYWGMADSPIDDAGWLHTGDVGYLDEGDRLHITDRLKDIIIRGGENISPTTVEDVLRSHPAVREVGVFGLPDPRFGELICAAVVTDGRVSLATLREHCADRLARFEVPDRWWLRTAGLSSGAMHKISRRQLREEYLRETEPVGSLD